MAFSLDGISWSRVSDTIPVIPKGSPQDPKWESRVMSGFLLAALPRGHARFARPGGRRFVRRHHLLA